MGASHYAKAVLLYRGLEMARKSLYASLAALVPAAGCFAALAADPAAVLHQAAGKIVAGIHKVPNYICSETVARTYYQTVQARRPRACGLVLSERRNLPPNFLRLFSIDRLRLDVIWTEKGETYAWSGASRFEDKGFETIAANGPMASGMFAGILTATFQSDVRSFRYIGYENLDGKDVMQYRFHVPDRDSHFKVKTDSSWVITAYQGTVLIDPATADVVHIEIETAELPPQTHACQSNYELDFNRVRLGDTPFLLPARARQWFIYPDGSEALTATEFGSCHEYLGESTIRFDEAASSPEAAASGAAAGETISQAAAVAPGLSFTTELLEDIDTGKAAAGDRFRARLVQDLNDTRGRRIAPAGSVVEGRLRLVEQLPLTHEVRVAMAPSSVFSGNTRLPLTATLVRGQIRQTLPSLPPHRQIGAAFQFSGEHAVIPTGFRTEWRTAAAKTK